MRIISGKFKGRNLVSFKADHIRPTMDRVKETLCNKWMGYFEQAVVLDLFAGTGNLGLEALSRGSRHVTFVESHKASIQLIQKNIATLGISDNDYQIHFQDVFLFLKKYQGPSFDLIFIDPPFTEKLADHVMKEISLSQCVSDQTLIAIEAVKQEKIELQYNSLICYDKINYGDKSLSLFQKS